MTGRTAARALIAGVLATLWAGVAQAAAPRGGLAPDAADTSSRSLPAAVMARNLAVATLASPAALDSLLARQQDWSTAARVGDWARRYLAWEQAEYCFGLADSGYVAAGLLVPGHRQDCISFLYRVTELALARTARHAIELAAARRFAGAPLARVCRDDGRVEYDDPAHLDFALDMIRSGLWGRDVTPTLTGVRPDTVGTARYAPGSFRWVPEEALQVAELQEGDLVWLVLEPTHAAARPLRDEHGLVIGHVGAVVVVDGERRLVHAASRPLAGHYDRSGVVSVPVGEYLARVERHGGVMVTRFAP